MESIESQLWIFPYDLLTAMLTFPGFTAYYIPLCNKNATG